MTDLVLNASHLQMLMSNPMGSVSKHHICLTNKVKSTSCRDMQVGSWGMEPGAVFQDTVQRRGRLEWSSFKAEILEPPGIVGGLSRKRWGENVKSLVITSNDIIGWRLKLGSLTCLLESLSLPSIVCGCSYFQKLTISRKWTCPLENTHSRLALHEQKSPELWILTLES